MYPYRWTRASQLRRVNFAVLVCWASTSRRGPIPYQTRSGHVNAEVNAKLVLLRLDLTVTIGNAATEEVLRRQMPASQSTGNRTAPVRVEIRSIDLELRRRVWVGSGSEMGHKSVENNVAVL